MNTDDFIERRLIPAGLMLLLALAAFMISSLVSLLFMHELFLLGASLCMSPFVFLAVFAFLFAPSPPCLQGGAIAAGITLAIQLVTCVVILLASRPGGANIGFGFIWLGFPFIAIPIAIFGGFVGELREGYRNLEE